MRMTYDAHLKIPSGLQALMSAERDSGSEGAPVFRMDLPIPAYLIALAVGDFDYVATGPRTGIYADPAILPAAAHELAIWKSWSKPSSACMALSMEAL